MKKLPFVFLAFIFILFSCSTSEPKVVSSSSYMILDYQDEKSLPSQRLAVFLETSSDVHRVSRFVITSRETSYEWNCFNPVIFSSDNRMWAGYSDFVVPNDAKIPSGIYDVKYADAEEKVFELILSVSYQQELLSSNSETVKDVISNDKFFSRYKEQIAIYDDENSLLYFGETKDSWKNSDKDIFDSIKDSAYYRNCIVISGNNTVCILPPVYKNESLEKSQNRNEE